MTIYLIAHKVRGAAAFDVAEKLQIGEEEGWIISTSGHRAYPYKYWSLADIAERWDPVVGFLDAHKIPDGWPDHYSANDTKPPKSKSDLSLEDLGL